MYIYIYINNNVFNINIYIYDYICITYITLIMYQIRIVKIYLQKNGSSMICYVYSLPAIRIPPSRCFRWPGHVGGAGLQC